MIEIKLEDKFSAALKKLSARLSRISVIWIASIRDAQLKQGRLKTKRLKRLLEEN